ncbi:MAG: peptidylprolyl isomerase [candidate division KSB1 bacterium]|nr:peptidylprolyl isomerase [candidate division KSB1 bacterium]
MRWVKAIGVLLFFLFLLTCDRQVQDKSPVIATAGQSEYTLDQLKNMLPDQSGLELSNVQVRNYIRRWVERELVFNKALEEDLNKDPFVQKKLKELEKEYLVALYLDKYLDSNIVITEDEIQAFYQENKQSFIRPATLYDVHYFLVDTYRNAYDIRRRLLNNESLETIAEDSTFKQVSGVYRDYGWVEKEKLSDFIQNRLRYLDVEEPSKPYKSDAGYYILYLAGLRKEGEPQTLEEVRDRVKQMINAAKREEKYVQLVNELKENIYVKVDWTVLDSIELLNQNKVDENE